MIGAILYVLGIFAILLVLDFERRHRADHWQRVIPPQMGGERSGHPAESKEPTSTEHEKNGAWNQRRAA